MKDIRINKHFYVIALFALVGVQIVCANETFQNNLLKMDVYKSSLGGVKVTLYTSKPYSDSVTVNKKGDNEYVILMPETSNSMTARPTLKSVSDKVKSVDVKTQQYQNQVKGYTKIVISTHGETDITPQVQTLATSDYRVSEKDYKELLSQIGKKTVTESKNVPVQSAKPVKTASKVATAPPRPGQRSTAPQVAKQTKQAPVRISTPVFVQKTMDKLTQQNNVPQKVAQKPQSKSEPVKTQKIAQNNIQPAAETSPELEQANSQDVVTPKTEKQPQAEEKSAQVQAPTAPAGNKVSTTPAKFVSMLHKIKTIVKNNVYTALGLIFAVFIILLLGARKMTQNIKRQKEIFAKHLDEKPFSATDYTEKIDDNMTWKEKFQTYVETKESKDLEESAPQEKPLAPQSSSELDDLFGNEPSFDESEDVFEEEIPESEIIQTQESFVPEGYEDLSQYGAEENEISAEAIDEISIDELFGEDEEPEEESFDFDEEPEENVLAEEQEQEIVQEDEPEDELLKSEFVIDDGKGFYLVDFEDTTALVGHIEDEIFVLKRFDRKISAPIQARLNERKINSVSFMTKVGSFRGVVEVTPEKMNLLIEL